MFNALRYSLDGSLAKMLAQLSYQITASITQRYSIGLYLYLYLKLALATMLSFLKNCATHLRQQTTCLVLHLSGALYCVVMMSAQADAPPTKQPNLLASYSVKPLDQQPGSSLHQLNKYLAMAPMDWDDDVLHVILAAEQHCAGHAICQRCSAVVERVFSHHTAAA